MSFIYYVEKLRNADSDYLIEKCKSSLDKMVKDLNNKNNRDCKNQEIRNERLHKAEAVVQLLQIRKLSPRNEEALSKLKKIIDDNSTLKCRCEGHNSFEVVGLPREFIRSNNTNGNNNNNNNINNLNMNNRHDEKKNKDKDIDKGKDRAGDESKHYHVYGRLINELFKKWQRSDKKLNFDQYLDRYITPRKRAELNRNIVKYLTPDEASKYKTYFVDGKIYSRGLKLTSRRYMFVLDVAGVELYLAKKSKGYFHHTSFLGAAPVKCAGFITLVRNRIVAIKGHSGHYKPTAEHMIAFKNYLADPKRMGAKNVEKIHITVFKKNSSTSNNLVNLKDVIESKNANINRKKNDREHKSASHNSENSSDSDSDSDSSDSTDSDSSSSSDSDGESNRNSKRERSKSKLKSFRRHSKSKQSNSHGSNNNNNSFFNPKKLLPI